MCLTTAVHTVTGRARAPLREDLPTDTAALAAAVADANIVVASSTASVYSGLSSLSLLQKSFSEAVNITFPRRAAQPPRTYRHD